MRDWEFSCYFAPDAFYIWNLWCYMEDRRNRLLSA